MVNFIDTSLRKIIKCVFIFSKFFWITLDKIPYWGLLSILALLFIFLAGLWHFYRKLAIAKKKLSPNGVTWKKIQKEVRQIRNPSPESIRAVIAASTSKDTFLQAKYYAHISHFVLWGLLGTIIGLFLALMKMNGIFNLDISMEGVIEQFQAILPNMSLAFLSTIAGILLSLLGRWFYYKRDLTSSLKVLENSLIQETVSSQKPRNEVFEEFIEVFSSRFREEFLHEFSETVRNGFNEGVKEFGQSIQQMGNSVTGAMDRLSDIGNHLSSFTNAFKRAGSTVTKMDEVVQGLNANLRESAVVLHEATELLTQQVLQFGTIIENTGKIEGITTTLEKKLGETTDSQKNLVVALSKQEKWAQDLGQVIDANNDKMHNLADSLSNVVDAEHLIASTVSDLNKNQLGLMSHIDGLATEIKFLSDETTGYRGILESISERSERSRELLLAVNNAIDQMGIGHQSLVTLQKELLEASKGISDKLTTAAQNMSQWGELQENSIGRLESLSTKLTNADDKQLYAYDLFISSFEEVRNKLIQTIQTFGESVSKLQNAVGEISNIPKNVTRDLRDLAQATRNIQEDFKNSAHTTIKLQEDIEVVFNELHEELLRVIKSGNRE